MSIETKRLTVSTAEEILEKEYKCLDKGFVRLVDYSGGDARIVQAARISYGKGTKTIREDTGLINYLIKNQHTSPLEQVTITVHMKMPIFVARQLVRTRTARLNEISGRYSELKNECYVPELNQICYQATSNKQGRSEPLPKEEAVLIQETFKGEQENSFDNYAQYLTQNVAKEIARINLPLSTYTEWYWQIDLNNLFKTLKLRLDWHAQYEIRVYAQVLAYIASQVAPIAYKAFEEHILNAVTFSQTELKNLAYAVFLNTKQEGYHEKLSKLVTYTGLSEKDAKELLDKSLRVLPYVP